ncbi:hypothetical protein ACQ4WX_50835 [Streptomyces lasalocidi]
MSAPWFGKCAGLRPHYLHLGAAAALKLGLPPVGALLVVWASAHSQYAAQPTPDRPEGAIIATTAPGRWIGEPVRVLDLNP